LLARRATGRIGNVFGDKERHGFIKNGYPFIADLDISHVKVGRAIWDTLLLRFSQQTAAFDVQYD
jgi:hypothetical protein